MICLMSAVTGSQANVLCLLHNVAGPLMVQDMQGIFRGKHRLLHVDTAQLCLRGIEKVFYKVLLHIHILIIQFAEILLVNIPLVLIRQIQ